MIDKLKISVGFRGEFPYTKENPLYFKTLSGVTSATAWAEGGVLKVSCNPCTLLYKPVNVWNSSRMPTVIRDLCAKIRADLGVDIDVGTLVINDVDLTHYCVLPPGFGCALGMAVLSGGTGAKVTMYGDNENVTIQRELMNLVIYDKAEKYEEQLATLNRSKNSGRGDPEALERRLQLAQEGLELCAPYAGMMRVELSLKWRWLRRHNLSQVSAWEGVDDAEVWSTCLTQFLVDSRVHKVLATSNPQQMSQRPEKEADYVRYRDGRKPVDGAALGYGRFGHVARFFDMVEAGRRFDIPYALDSGEETNRNIRMMGQIVKKGLTCSCCKK